MRQLAVAPEALCAAVGFGQRHRFELIIEQLRTAERAHNARQQEPRCDS